MKTRLLMLLTFVILSSSLLSINAVPQLDPTHAFNYSEIVMIGKILSVEILSEPQITKTETTYREISGIALYTIHVEEYLKNASAIDTVIVHGLFLREPHPMAYETYPYDVDQRVLLYLQKNDHEYANTDLIIRTGDSKVIGESICDLGSYFDKGLCVIIDDSTNTPVPSCKSGPRPEGEGWVFVECQWKQFADVTIDNCQRGKAPANNYAWNSQDCLWEWSPLRNENASGPSLMESDTMDEPTMIVHTSKDDAPFFGIFVYLDDLISWIMGTK